MRCLLRVLGVACLVACATVAFAGPVTDSISFQGRLTDAGDIPVADGPRDMILSFWSDSVGGTMLFSELRSVDVAAGLYTTCIGCDDAAFFDIFTDQPIYLQVQLAGEAAMTPRTALRYAPRALMSARVRGDMYTENGRLLLRSNLGSSGQDGVEILTDDTSSVLRMACCLGSSGEDGVEVRLDGSLRRIRVGNLGSSGQDGVSITDDGLTSSLELSRTRLGRPAVNTVSLRAAADSVTDYRDNDSDDDGVFDTRMAVVLGNGGGGGGGGGGLAGGAGGSMVMVVDIDDDGSPESEYAQRISPTTSSLAIKTKGTSAQRLGAGGDCDDTNSDLYVYGDDDGDGVPEREVAQRITPTTASLAINTKGTGAKRLHAGGDCDDTDETSSLYVDSDDDNDGIPDREVTQVVTPTTSSVAIKTKGTGADKDRVASSTTTTMFGDVLTVSTVDDDGDGFPDNEYEQHVTPTTCSVAINTKGTGAEKGRVAFQTEHTGGVSSSMVLDYDDDGDGVPENDIESFVTPTTSSVAINVKGTGADKNRVAFQVEDAGGLTSSMVLDHDSDGDGVSENDIESIVTPTTCSVAIKTRGTGADKNRVIGSTDDTTAVVLLATDSATISMSVRRGGNVKGNINVGSASNARMVDLDSDGNGYFATGLGVGVDPTHHIDVVGGAYCDGTDWVNASDENAKENFTAVDGESLLEKIEELPVTQWNYKNDPDDRLHIGPTAQDFQATFGVGSDGKSISTIDPSGIALAAIKELSRQNKELKAQNGELQKQLDEINQKLSLLLQKQ